MNDYILNLFKGDDMLRPNLMSPSLDGKYVYATNGNCLAKVEKDKLSIKYDSVSNFPKVEHFFDFKENQYSFLVSELAEKIAFLDFKYNRKECEKCKGTGDVECRCCGNVGECKDCDGTGESNELTFLSKRVFDVKDKIKIGECLFNPNYLDRILVASFAQRVDKITILNNNKDQKGKIFRVGCFDILIMPMLNME